MTHTKEVLMEPDNGGKECGETTRTEDCNMDACPTEPTCVECSFYDGDKKGCVKDGPKTGLMCEDCAWDKKKDLCTGMTCNSFTAMGPFKCSKAAKKFKDVVGECFWHLHSETCGPGPVIDQCADYNNKKLCKKLGKAYLGCKYEKNSKLCLTKDAVLTCSMFPAKKSKCNAEMRKPKGGCSIIDGVCAAGEAPPAPEPTCADFTGKAAACQSSDLGCYQNV